MVAAVMAAAVDAVAALQVMSMVAATAVMAAMAAMAVDLEEVHVRRIQVSLVKTLATGKAVDSLQASHAKPSRHVSAMNSRVTTRERHKISAMIHAASRAMTSTTSNQPATHLPDSHHPASLQATAITSAADVPVEAAVAQVDLVVEATDHDAQAVRFPGVNSFR